MSSEQVLVTVTLLDQEYRFGCAPEEKDSLLAAARYLDQQMRGIKRAGRVVGLDRIAVMAALNIANELLENRRTYAAAERSAEERLRALQERVDSALVRRPLADE